MANAKLAEFIDGTGGEGTARARHALGLPAAYAAPGGAVERRLADLWQAALNVDRVGIDDDFFELGGDSLAGAQLFAAVEQAFGRRLPLSALLEGPTIRRLAARLAGAAPAGADEALVALRAGGGRPPLFCAHPLNGTALAYRRLAAHLGEDQPVYGLQYPARQMAGVPRPGLPDLAASYCEAIRGVQPAGPYRLAGFSLGGAIAYEIAVRLRAAGEEVALLALLDTAAPGHGRGGPARFPRHARELARRPPWAWPSYLLGRWRNRRARDRAGRAIPDGTVADGPMARSERRAAEVLRRAWQDYAPGPYDGRVVLFRCAEDIAHWRHAPEMGWNGLAAGGVETRDVPSTHQHLMHEPAVALLAAQLQACLTGVRDRPAGPGPGPISGS